MLNGRKVETDRDATGRPELGNAKIRLNSYSSVSFPIALLRPFGFEITKNELFHRLLTDFLSVSRIAVRTVLQRADHRW